MAETEIESDMVRDFKNVELWKEELAELETDLANWNNPGWVVKERTSVRILLQNIKKEINRLNVKGDHIASDLLDQYNYLRKYQARISTPKGVTAKIADLEKGIKTDKFMIKFLQGEYTQDQVQDAFAHWGAEIMI